MPLSRTRMQTLQDTMSRERRDTDAVNEMVLEIENRAMEAASKFGSSFYEFYEYKPERILPRLRSEVYARLCQAFDGCKVLHTDAGFYISWA